ncbi:MAG: hypothetical protein IPJ16_08885 [Bacteroidales bacterium]|nr:hypothetical protein [Bacteroidales bacterium]
MKATIILMFSFIFITGSLFGQKDKHNYIDSDIKKQFFPITDPVSPLLGKPDLHSPKKIDNPILRDLDRFGLYPNSSLFKDKKVPLYSDIVVVEEFSGASRFYCYPFVRKPDTRGKILIIKPDTSEDVKYHLIIKDPIRHTITK